VKVLPSPRRIYVYAVLIILLLVSYYFLPHSISFKEEINSLHIAEVEYIAKMGMIKEVRYYNSNNDILFKDRFIMRSMPIYKLHSRHRYLGDYHEYYDKPGLGHWSTLTFDLDNGHTVVLKDDNQDGVVDKCYTEKTRLTI
jgi:hypothetical protein